MSRVPAIRQFAGDIRLWEKAANGDLIAVIPEADDPSGNQPIETNSLQFSYEAGEEQKIVSKRRDARYNQPVYSEQLPGTTQVALTLLELPPLILARILFGEGSTATVSAGSVADQPLAVPRIDVPVQLPHRMLLAAPAPVFKKGETELEEGTDYTLDLRRGQVFFKATVEAGFTTHLLEPVARERPGRVGAVHLRDLQAHGVTGSGGSPALAPRLSAWPR